MTSIPRLRSASQLRQPAQSATSSTTTTTITSSPAKHDPDAAPSLLRKPSRSLRAPAISSLASKRSASQLAASTRQASRPTPVVTGASGSAPVASVRPARPTSIVVAERAIPSSETKVVDPTLKRVPSLLRQPSKSTLPTVRPVRSHLPLGSTRTVSSSSTQRRAIQRATSISGLSTITSQTRTTTKLSSPSVSSIGSATPTPLTKTKPLAVSQLKRGSTLRDSPSKLPTPLRRNISTSLVQPSPAPPESPAPPLQPASQVEVEGFKTKIASTAVPDTPLMPRFCTSGPDTNSGHWALGASLIKDTDLYTSRLHGPDLGVGRLSDVFSPIKPTPVPLRLARPTSRPLLTSTKPSVPSGAGTSGTKVRPASVVLPRRGTPLTTSTLTPLGSAREGETQSGELDKLRERVAELEKGEKQLLLENQVLQDENKRLLEEKKAWVVERTKMSAELESRKEEMERQEKELAVQVAQAALVSPAIRGEDDLTPLRPLWKEKAWQGKEDIDIPSPAHLRRSSQPSPKLNSL